LEKAFKVQSLGFIVPPSGLGITHNFVGLISGHPYGVEV
jgi:hypothetical protein